jgi:hypothetical protein
VPPVNRAVWAILFALGYLAAAYGLYWDIQWHFFVGRDSFWIPPHILLYSGIALAGLSAFLSILCESIRRRSGDGSVAFLGIFRGARGMFVAGFGILFIVIAAPLDDYWHRLYGIDVTLWAPFHLMGLFGSLMGLIGLMYVLAGLGNAARGTRWKLFGYNFYQWLLLFELGAAYGLILIIAQPGFVNTPIVHAGPIDFMTAALIVAGPLTFLTTAAVAYAGRAAAALAVYALFLVRNLTFVWTVPLATLKAVPAYGFTFRNPAVVPHVLPSLAATGLVLLPGALMIALLSRNGKPSALTGAFAGALFGAGAVVLAQLGAPPGFAASPATVVVTLAADALIGIIGATLGRGFGALLACE